MVNKNCSCTSIASQSLHWSDCRRTASRQEAGGQGNRDDQQGNAPERDRIGRAYSVEGSSQYPTNQQGCKNAEHDAYTGEAKSLAEHHAELIAALGPERDADRNLPGSLICGVRNDSVGSGIAASAALPWICSGPAHPGALQQPAPSGGRLTLPSASAPAESQAGQGRVVCLRVHESQGADLSDHAYRPAPSRPGDLQPGPHAETHSDGPGPCTAVN